MYNLSACCFIRDTFRGAFCVFESAASLLPFCDEMVIMDLGSTDGTLEYLEKIANKNPKIRILESVFPETDAKAFATLANDVVAACSNDRVIYFQADEIWHEDLLRRMGQEFAAGNFDLAFWRIQYRDNFQRVKWFPHLVHRVGIKGRFKFDGDGMTTNRTWDAKICSQYDGGWFPRWDGLGQEGIKPFVNEMITDVSLVGGFRDNIPDRRSLHAPFWHEGTAIEGKPAGQWLAEAQNNPDWTRPESPYNLPAILRFHVGRTRYDLRQELLEALQNDSTQRIIGL